MKPKFSLGLLAGLLLLGGCLPSLNAVFTDENLVFDASVVGLWTQPGGTATWDFTARNATSYLLVFTDNDGRSARFVGHLANVQGVQFLDLAPEKVETGASPFFDVHLVPLHTIYLVRQTTPTLELAAMDYAWLEKFLGDHPDAIEHASFNGRIFLTAPTEDVQTFVIEHKEAFNANFYLERASAHVN